MKMITVLAASFSVLVAAPAFAAPVSMTFQNVGTTTMTPTNVNSCGVLSPTPTTVLAGGASPTSSTDCGTSSYAHVTYTMGSKQCIFHISTTYTPPNPDMGQFEGYWTPSATATASGGAICRVTSMNITNAYTTGAFAATYSMK